VGISNSVQDTASIKRKFQPAAANVLQQFAFWRLSAQFNVRLLSLMRDLVCGCRLAVIENSQSKTIEPPRYDERSPATLVVPMVPPAQPSTAV
jgi:hypothetical protein